MKPPRHQKYLPKVKARVVKRKGLKAPTAAQRRRYSAIVALGCIVGPNAACQGRITVHHCFTGAGGRKDHGNTIPLCWGHHQGPDGIDGKQKYTKRSWQERYGTERELLNKTEAMLAQMDMLAFGTSKVFIGIDPASPDGDKTVIVKRIGETIIEIREQK